MFKEKVSIVVPVYKVEKYIEKCVTSLINQNYKNIEIILVDDGSPDTSANMIDRLALADTRVKVIHKENGGVSSARNAGLDAASGQYIMFVDGDDWVEPDYVSYFLGLVKSNGCVIGMNKYNFQCGNGYSSDKTYVISSEKAIEWIYMGQIFVAVWNKIYLTDFLKENALRFNNEIWYGEGMLFNIECLQCCDTIAVGEKCVYHQTFNADSAMRSFNLKSNFCGIRSMELQRERWTKLNPRIEQAWAYHRYCFNRSILDGIVRSHLDKDNRELANECRKNIRKDIRIPLTSDIPLKQKFAWIAYAIAPDMMACRSARKFRDAVEKWGGYSENT